MMTTVKKCLLFLLLIWLDQIARVLGKSGRLSFTTSGGKELEVSSKNCTGIFFKSPTAGKNYDCSCVTGVWIFYEQFCGEPLFFLGGYDYCFGLGAFKKIAQAAQIGNFRDPFEPSIGHFQKENFIQLTTSISENEYHEYNNLEVDALGSWITVTNSKWTLHGDGGESICLHPTVQGWRVICTYNQRLLSVIGSMNWNTIIHVQNGCYSNVTVKADACFPLRRPNGKTNCKTRPPVLTPCPDPDNPNDSNPPDPYCEPDIETTTPVHPPTTTPGNKICGDITREDVKRYWLDPASNQCAKSLNEAMLTDQLRRFAATRFDQIFGSRVQSLNQMKQLIIHSRDIIKKTCIEDFVPAEFFDVATEAFLMFITEDFFYGVEGIAQISFDRVMTSLDNCLKRAKPFVYESVTMGCNLRKITGSLILPGKKIDISIPNNAKSKPFEPLIETTWKMFLNAHAYCFDDFQISNDHHHFSVLFLELFSKTIYEKWIEPLPNRDLYKFILPKFEIMNEIMENIDYCVAATGQVSQCPVWMTRSNPVAKPIVGPSVIVQNTTGNTSTTTGRKKRSTWIRGIYEERTNIWDGAAYCVHNMVDPSRLGLAACTEAF